MQYSGALIAINWSAAISIGVIASFLLYVRSLVNPISQISQQMNTIFMAIAGAQRVFEVLDKKSETDEGYVTLVNANIDEKGNITESETRTGKWAWKHPHHDGTVSYVQLKGDVRFENVVFGYEENKIVLNGITLYAEPGQKIAFVGSTGAGKTTITNLINRFYDVPDGKIRYDGININKIKKADLRRSLGMVLQDTHLFTGTVMDNIRYGRLDATDEECIQAAKTANAHQFIKHLPQGYDTVLTRDGENLSQGQRQCLQLLLRRSRRSSRSDSGRGYKQHRHPYRMAHRKRYGRTYGRTYRICNCSPAQYGTQQQCNNGARTRQNNRKRKSRATHCTEGQVLPVVYGYVRIELTTLNQCRRIVYVCIFLYCEFA